MAEERDGSSRAEREASFHNARFGGESDDRSADRFYELTKPSKGHFADLISSIPAGAATLELGCGLEAAAWGLIDRGVDVTGIDISPVAIESVRAEAEHRSIRPERFVVMNAEDLDFPDDSFDVVIGAAILHHLDLYKALPEIRRVLRPGGKCYFLEPSGKNPLINLYRRLTPDQRSDDERPFTDAEFETLEGAFDHVDITTYHLTSLAALGLLRTKYFDSVAGRLESVDAAIFKRMPSTSRYAWVLIIEAAVNP